MMRNLQMLLICSVLLIIACKGKLKEEPQSGYHMEGDLVELEKSCGIWDIRF